MRIEDLQPWEALMKQIVWRQLGEIRGKRILDFGSGQGVTADHFAEYNEVVAVEPDREAVAGRWQKHVYSQLIGSVETLRDMADASFDIIICHNVLEYAKEREAILGEFARLLKPDGYLSLVKHNRPGRVMQMVVLLNDFEQADKLLDGGFSTASKFGTIRYYEDTDVAKWCEELQIVKTYGMRTFWDLQQKQEQHGDQDWQQKMIAVEMRVSELEPYRSIAFFHHLILRKRGSYSG